MILCYHSSSAGESLEIFGDLLTLTYMNRALGKVVDAARWRVNRGWGLMCFVA